MRGQETMKGKFVWCAVLLSVPVVEAQPQNEGLFLSDAGVEIVINSTPLGRSSIESAQPVSVLGGRGLRLRDAETIGETVAEVPGVSTSTFGAGASRPVIRGLGGERVRVMENGLGTKDISSTSPDHAVAIDPSLADQVEVVRGPAALMFGTSAVGGVVNAVNGRIPLAIPDGPASGEVESSYGTVDESREGSGKLDVPFESFVLHLDGSLRKSDDYRIPGFARTPAVRAEESSSADEPRGKVPFSSTERESGAVGGSYFLENGVIGGAISAFDTTYGVPNGEEDVSVDLTHRRYEGRSRLDMPLPLIETSDIKIAYSDYSHDELEQGEVGTRFTSEGIDTRAELRHLPIGVFEGLLGLQLQQTDFSATGAEAFLPSNDELISSIFLFEELPLDRTVKLQLGARVDSTEREANGYTPPGTIGGDSVGQTDFRRNFVTTSFSSGVVMEQDGGNVLALALAYTERAPSAQELFANGAHVATGAFEIGDPDLGVERSIGVDVSLRRTRGAVTGSLGGFYNRFFDYIDLSGDHQITVPPDGEEALEVLVFRQEDAQFFGAEAELDFHLFGPVDEQRPSSTDCVLFARADWLWAAQAGSGTPLSRMPPARIAGGIRYQDEKTEGSLEVAQLFRQERNNPAESETPGYTDLKARAAYEIIGGPLPVELFVRGENLLNAKERNHVSFLKDIAPLPGLTLISGLTTRF